MLFNICFEADLASLVKGREHGGVAKMTKLIWKRSLKNCYTLNNKGEFVTNAISYAATYAVNL